MIDHRRLGRELELFATDPLAGSGLPLWLPDGAAARHAVEEYLREEERRAGYQHVNSPPLGKKELYLTSGHLPHYADDMFPVMALSEDDEFVLRPSACPHHALVYRSRGRSYRELPLRIAELGGMYRAERSGVLGGLSRVRGMWLNDAHVFAPLSRVADEIGLVLRMIGKVHAALGVKPAGFRLSLRGDGPKYAGDGAMWDRAEAILRDVLRESGRAFAEEPGEAAFYGPKIDIQVVDAGGREMTLSTVQLDFHQPARFGLSYVDAAGARQVPVMIHRSLAGSMERLFAYLIEVHDGAFPLWYAPRQLQVLPVSAAQEEAAHEFCRAAVYAGLRAEVVADGSVSSRVRRSAQQRVPYAAIIGPAEAAAGEVSLRPRNERGLAAMPAEAALRRLREEADPHAEG
ncbi:threonine--tRNA ligase [Catenuloplanes indicus]|uniref:Threonine--tRNA ligase n=1 Tax=Catenuloplanes indicus TaxID=137267 RepID=A0AAE3W4D5_9ACTN|nr:threonine--tRNA ligase [Catenuloplanes indicus]MDQ0368489.1 threonyl-tRNA synthetase [Catenuloplanes indicus]